MNKQQIIDLWKSVGWNNSKDYHNCLISGKRPDDVIGWQLSPERINPKEFWKATDEVFFTDTVSNCCLDLGDTHSIEVANYKNHLIPLFLGLYGGMEFAMMNCRRKFKATNIAEIGFGYGSFEDLFIDKHRLDIDYYCGFDIVPRKDYVIELGDDGTFTKDQTREYKERFNIFYSCNVFQHLSPFQITKYLNQIYHMLPFGGYFVFSYIKKPNSGETYHYGQRVEIMSKKEIKNLIKETGFKIWFAYKQNSDYSEQLDPIGFVLEKI